MFENKITEVSKFLRIGIYMEILKMDIFDVWTIPNLLLWISSEKEGRGSVLHTDSMH